MCELLAGLSPWADELLPQSVCGDPALMGACVDEKARVNTWVAGANEGCCIMATRRGSGF